MTDQQAIINPAPAGTSPETLSAYRQVLARHFGTAQVDHALGPTATPAPTVRAPITSDIATKVTLTASEVASGADTLRKHWSGDKAELEKALSKVPGAGPNTTPQPSQADPFVPGTSAEDYRLNWPYSMKVDGDPGALQSVAAATTAAFASAQVPLSHAQPLLDALTEASTLVVGKTAAELEMHDEEIARQVGTVLGEGAFEKAAAMARSFGPKAFERLKASGAFRSVQAVVMLNSVADAIAYRKSKS